MNEEEKISNQESFDQEIQEAAAPVVPTTLEQRKRDNLDAMRRKLEAAEEAKNAAEQRAAEIERRASQYRQESPQLENSSEPEDSIDVEDEDYVQAKYVKKSNKKVSSELKAIREELNQLRQDNTILRAEKTTDKLSDFNDVVSSSNLATLQRLYPDDYETVMANPNLKSKSVTAYNMMIKYGIAEPKTVLTKTEQIQAVERKIEENKLRPVSSSNARASASPLSSASRYDHEGRLRLTEADKDRILRDMRRKQGFAD